MNSKKIKVVAVIPSRYSSVRFEGKPLAKIAGKPMIYHVYSNAKKCKILDEVIVATEDERIRNVVAGFGGKVVMTSDQHPTGTDRVAEAVQNIDADVIVNVQGDEPLVDPDMIKRTVDPFLKDQELQVANLIAKIKDVGDYVDPGVVKAVVDKNDFLLFLTRAPIPHPKTRANFVIYKQIGLYAFRREFLFDFLKMKQTDLELIEGIEFLRILENRISIKAVFAKHAPISVDTLSDLIEVEKILRKRNARKL